MSADDDTRRLAAASLAAGDATGWFERLYAEAGAGTARVPWDLPRPSATLVRWAYRGALAGAGRSALVVGCGLGRDAEYLAARGFVTSAFDISATAVRTARQRHPGTAVAYTVADLLDPPPRWRGRFDLVVESSTVQALPQPQRAAAIANVGPLVAPGGTLLVLAAAAGPGPAGPGPAGPGPAGPGPAGLGADEREAGEREAGGPPWPLTRAEIDAFAGPGLVPVSVEQVPADGDPLSLRWVAELHRPV